MNQTTTRITKPQNLYFLRIVWFSIAIPLILLTLYALANYPAATKQSVPPIAFFNLVPESSPAEIRFVDDQLTAAGFEVGDRIISTNGFTDYLDFYFYTPLPHVGEDYVYLVAQEDGNEREITLQGTVYVHLIVQTLVRFSVPFGLSSVIATIFAAIAPVVFFTLAFLIFWKRSDDWLAIFISIVLLMLGTLQGPNRFGVSIIARTSYLLFAVGLAIPLMWFAILSIPDGKLKPRWGFVIVSLITVVRVFADLRFILGADFLPIPPQIWSLVELSTILLQLELPAILVILWWKRRELKTAENRQQLKWVWLGFSMQVVAFILPVVFGIIQQAGYPQVAQIYFVISLPIQFILSLGLPASLGFAILRYRLWDVDLVINRSIVYGFIAVLVITQFFAALVLLQIVIGNTTPIFALLASGAISVAIMRPLSKRVQHWVDRYIYRLRFDLNELRNVQHPPTIHNPGQFTGLVLDDYEVLGLIGKGGMGEVYEGVGNRERVAIKTMLPDIAKNEELRTRFEREAEAGKVLQHPHIAQVFLSGQHNSTPYLIMEYVDGKDLSEVLDQQSRLDAETAVRLLQDIGKALDLVHGQGYVHRDIKPSNIMIRENGAAVLMDFGISKVQDALTITGTGAVGTIQYMAPEQIVSAKDVDGRADIYALSCVLYQMMTGETPFKGGAAQIMFAHLQQPAPDPRDVRPDTPDTIAEGILRGLEKDPSNRFEDINAFIGALKTI